MRIIGNENTMKQLSIAVRSAVADDRPLPHTLLSGSAGCGKTTTAKSIAQMLGGKFISVVPQSLKTRDDVVNLLNHLDRTGYDVYGSRIKGVPIKPSVVFIDEIHALNIDGQENLGIIMENWEIEISHKQAMLAPNGNGSKRKSMGAIRWCPYFTLVGATTNDGLLTKPFRDRFKLRFLFSPYNTEESIEIIKEHAAHLNVTIDELAVKEIASRGRGVPRILVKLLERCKDMLIISEEKVVSHAITSITFDMMGIDRTGLTKTDIKLMKSLYETGEKLGIDNLSIILNEPPKVVSETIEPYLIQRGFIARSAKGRALTDAGEKYLLDNGYISITDKVDFYDLPTGTRRNLNAN